MKTGIPELDEMIGLRNTGGETEEIDSGSVMLIRGEPGSGKTTLGLQILSNNAKDLAGAQTVSHPPQPADRAKFLFISLEQEPTHVLRRVHESYLFFQDTPVQEILHFDRHRGKTPGKKATVSGRRSSNPSVTFCSAYGRESPPRPKAKGC
jgi:RecA-family ATPase